MRRLFDITLWALPALAVLLLWQVAGGARLGAFELGSAASEGLYPVERGELGEFRWAGPRAALWLPGGGLPGVLTLRGAVAPGARVALALGAAPEVTLPAGAAAPQLRRYALLLPAGADRLGRAELRLSAEPAVRIAGRELSVAMAEVAIRPVTRGPRLPPLGSWLALAALPLLGGGALWLAGLGQRPAALFCASTGLALVGLWAARPARVEPLLLDLAAFGGAADQWLWWWLLAQAAAIAAWPLTRGLLRGLPLAGYPLAPAVGLLVIGWGAWALAALGLAPFGPLTVAGVALALAAVGWGGWWRQRRQGAAGVATPIAAQIQSRWATRWRPALAWQLLLIGGLFVGCWLRWHGAVGPALSGTEKPMEIAMLSAVMRYERFPPPDPWLAGYGLNYYYLGYAIVGALAELSNTPPEVAFNLGFALIVALTIVGVAYAAYALAAATPGLPRRGPALAAGLALLLALAVGSQASALQLMIGSPLFRALDAGQLVAALSQRGAGAQLLQLGEPTPPSWDGPPFDTIAVADRPSYDWFLPSRALYDDVALPGGGVERRYAITEFPAFSLYLGDLHPHVLALPCNLLALALALRLAAGRRHEPGAARQSNQEQRPGSLLLRPAAFLFPPFAAGWLVGALYALNAWDAPTYGLLLAGALALGRRTPAGRLEWRGWSGDLVALAVGALLAALPFLISFTPPAGPPRPGALDGLPLLGRLAATIGLAANRTQLHSFLILFGLFLVPLVALALAGRATTAHNQPAPSVGGRASQGLPQALRLLATLALGLALGFPLLFLVPLALGLALAGWRAARPAAALLRWAAAVGALALLVPELVYIRDQLEGEMSRMITIFKFVFQAWLLWAIVSAVAAVGLFRPRSAPLATLAWAAPALLLLIGALVYPLGLARWGQPWRPAERSLDGLAFLARTAPDELAAARWLARSLQQDEVLLSGFCNCDYEQISRVAAISGVQSLLGWMDGHERVWRSGAPDQLAEIARRERDIPLIYAGGEQAAELLRHYAIDYVYIGPTERRLYAAPGLEALAARLEPAFSQGTVTIYRVPGGGP